MQRRDDEDGCGRQCDGDHAIEQAAAEMRRRERNDHRSDTAEIAADADMFWQSG